MTGKVCPFDKKPCIGSACAVYNENAEKCAFLFCGGKIPGNSSPRKGRTVEESGRKFKAHLFD